MPNSSLSRRALLALLGGAGLASLAACAEQRTPRQREVARRGRDVMPFDLEKTTHRFTEKPDGLLQEVVAKDSGDNTQIRLVRQHLTEEVERFQRGDFADPASIHGADMPGLEALEAGAERISIAYRRLPAGAAIRFRTRDSGLVKALHSWAQAQVSDHGGHAEHG